MCSLTKALHNKIRLFAWVITSHIYVMAERPPALCTTVPYIVFAAIKVFYLSFILSCGFVTLCIHCVCSNQGVLPILYSLSWLCNIVHTLCLQQSWCSTYPSFFLVALFHCAYIVFAAIKVFDLSFILVALSHCAYIVFAVINVFYLSFIL